MALAVLIESSVDEAWICSDCELVSSILSDLRDGFETAMDPDSDTVCSGSDLMLSLDVAFGSDCDPDEISDNDRKEFTANFLLKIDIIKDLGSLAGSGLPQLEVRT